jgi:phosphatidylglycerophosphate synthase
MATTQPRPAAEPAYVDPRVGRLSTVPNAVTLARTTAAVALGLVATARGDLGLLGLAYVVYWVGDIADGWSARLLGQETRLGAVLDIVSDRACTGVLCVGLVATVDDPVPLLPVVGVFLMSFMVVDTVLSMAFLLWPLLGPNDFHLVDHKVWLLNWSPVAKAANTGVVVVAIVLGLTPVALVVAVGVLGIKLMSAGRVLDLLAERR